MNGVSRRIPALDVARGAALLGMFVYHLSWDFAALGLGPAGLPFSPPMRAFSHLVGGSFLLLAGVSLGQAHRGGFNRAGFLKRLAMVGGAAALVSLVTGFGAPDTPILFGILHCIAAASVLALPFLFLPGWAALAAGAAAVGAPFLFAADSFNSAALLWLGLGTREPSTLDWRPLLPWAGIALIGLGLAKLAPAGLFGSFLALWRPAAAPGRVLAFGGRHSLAVYLIHQPIFFGALYLVAQATGAPERQAAEAYLASCRPACVEAGGELGVCAKACACVVIRARDAGLAGALGSRAVSAAQREKVGAIVEACGSEAR